MPCLGRSDLMKVRNGDTSHVTQDGLLNIKHEKVTPAGLLNTCMKFFGSRSNAWALTQYILLKMQLEISRFQGRVLLVNQYMKQIFVMLCKPYKNWLEACNYPLYVEWLNIIHDQFLMCLHQLNIGTTKNKMVVINFTWMG